MELNGAMNDNAVSALSHVLFITVKNENRTIYDYEKMNKLIVVCPCM